MLKAASGPSGPEPHEITLRLRYSRALLRHLYGMAPAPHPQARQRLYGEREMTKLPPLIVDLRVIRCNLALRAFKTALHRLASSGNTYHHLQTNLPGCKGHGRGLLCGVTDAACPREPAASHGLQRISKEDLAPRIPTLFLRVTARTAPRSAFLRRGYRDGINLPQPPVQPRTVLAQGRPEAFFSVANAWTATRRLEAHEALRPRCLLI
jgi:hypothetical protein